MVNGARVSKNQRLLCEMVGGELNGAKVGRFTIDVTRQVGNLKIAFEFDTWFYHSANLERDRRKDQALLNDGWCIVRVRTENLLPTPTQLDEATASLVWGEKYVDIELADRGVGPRAPWTQDEIGDPPLGAVGPLTPTLDGGASTLEFPGDSEVSSPGPSGLPDELGNAPLLALEGRIVPESRDDEFFRC
jgi:hypothetical protein